MSRAKDLVHRYEAVSEMLGEGGKKTLKECSVGDVVKFKEGKGKKSVKGKVKKMNAEKDEYTIETDDGEEVQAKRDDFDVDASESDDRDQFSDWQDRIRSKYPEAVFNDKGDGTYDATYDGTVVGWYGPGESHVV